MKVGLIDQKHPQITWLGQYKPNTTPQQFPNEFTYKNRSYKIDKNGYWTLKPGVVCWSDPWVEAGVLCGFKVDTPEMRAQDQELAEWQATQMADFVLGDEEVYESPSTSTHRKPEIKINLKNDTVCKFYAQGGCLKGNTCRYKHTGTVVQLKKPPCKFFPKGQCKKGTLCGFSH